MTDLMSPKLRRALMRRIRAKHTKPELVVRKALHGRGFRYRLHAKIEGIRPDIVLPARRVAIFVNGCFWHGHNCHLFRWPKTREEFWKNKIAGNKLRDGKAVRTLTRKSWSVATIWECGLRDKKREEVDRLIGFLESWILNSSRLQSLTFKGSRKVTRVGRQSWSARAPKA